MKRSGQNLMREKKGMALLLVLCLFALLMAVGASMFFAAVSAVSSAAQSISDEQAALSAESFCDLVRRELTKDSTLKLKADQLKIKEMMPLSAELPDQMGTVEGSLTRTNDGFAVVEITAAAEKKRSRRKMGFTRMESVRTIGITEEGELITEIVISWAFAGYEP